MIYFSFKLSQKPPDHSHRHYFRCLENLFWCSDKAFRFPLAARFFYIFFVLTARNKFLMPRKKTCYQEKNIMPRKKPSAKKWKNLCQEKKRMLREKKFDHYIKKKFFASEKKLLKWLKMNKRIHRSSFMKEVVTTLAMKELHDFKSDLWNVSSHTVKLLFFVIFLSSKNRVD